LGPLALVVSDMLVALGIKGWISDFSMVPESVASVLSVDTALLLSLAVWAAALLVWLQTLAEEVGWRGYFLARMMRLLGDWPGLCLHGAVWGLWYAPTLLLANGGSGSSVLTSAGFVFTCCLLGTLLGFLRLASKSLIPATIANSVLTLVAGLPLLLRGDDPGLRGAAYGPAGWLPMIACVLVLAVSPLRRFVRSPQALARAQSRWPVVAVRDPREPLH
jgi:membrane protease YdiL (CAAX protease family)